MVESDELAVLLHDVEIGRLFRAIDGAGFAYNSNYMDEGEVPLSLSMPLRGEPPSTARATAWMKGLLPDNPDTREIMRRETGARSSEPFDLLATRAGHDCAGAVQFCHPEEISSLSGRRRAVAWLSSGDMAEIMDLLVAGRALPNSLPGTREFTLAGFQSKIALCWDAEKGWGMPLRGQPSTHILKPTIPRAYLPDQAVVEHLTQRAADALGIASAFTEIEEFGDIVAIVVTRLDRRQSEDGVARLHQEDMCQAMGLPPELRREAANGPSPQQIADLIWANSRQANHDVEQFFMALAYNWVIVGTDAHAKNYGMLLDDAGAALAPMYDMCAWLPFERDGFNEWDSVEMMMRIGHDFTVGAASGEQAWAEMGERMGLDGDEAVDIVLDIAEDVAAAFDGAAQQLPSEFRRLATVQRLLDRVEDRGRQCGLQVGEGGTDAGPGEWRDEDRGNLTESTVSPASPTALSECGRIVEHSGEPCRLLQGHEGACSSTSRAGW